MTTTIDPKTLARHLRAAAAGYQADAETANYHGIIADSGVMAESLRNAATQALEWADALEQDHQFGLGANGALVVFPAGITKP